MKRYIGLLARDFTVILSGNVIFTSIFITIFSIKVIDPSLLWQMISMAAVTSMLDIVFYLNGPLGKKSLIFKMIVHFILIYTLYVFAGSYFKWFDISDTSFLIYFSLFVLIGYALVATVICSNEYKQARLINKKLNEYKHKRSDDSE